MPDKHEADRHFRAALFRNRQLSRADAEYIRNAAPRAPWDSRLLQIGQVVAILILAQQLVVAVVRHSPIGVVICGLLLAIVVLGSLEWWLLRRNIARAISAPTRSVDGIERPDS